MPRSELLPLPGTPGLTLWSGLLGRAAADAMLARLLRQIPWRQPQVTLFGRTGPIPRLQSWHGDPDAEYSYSGLPLVPLPWTSELTLLRERVQIATGQPFNSVLVNLYRSGLDTMGWHADNETVLGPAPWIASYSLGASRDFTLRPRGSRRIDRSLPLGHDQLLLMPPPMQARWEHALPRRARVSSPRINLTFRFIYPV